MRRLVAFSLVIALLGCSGDDSKPDPSTPTTERTTSTTAEPVATSTTTTATVPSSTSTTKADEGTGGEAITVTEKITITITDPES